MPPTLPEPLPAPPPDLCLDFANSAAWRDGDAPASRLDSPDALLAWCGRFAPPGLTDAVRTAWGRGPEDAARDTEAALALRDALRALLVDLVGGDTPKLAAVRMLDDWLQRAPARQRLVWRDGAIAWRAEAMPDIAALLAPVLWSAADLLAGPRRAKLRCCANAGCRKLFVDDSRGASRRWCAMSACGNRAKAQRHYRRRRAAPTVLSA